MPLRTTVYLVDDQAFIRAIYKHHLHVTGRFVVVGEAEDGRQAAMELADLKPAVVLLDIAMPRLMGLDALPLIVAASPTSAVIMLSDFEQETLVRKAIDGGAHGYVSKADDPETVVVAVDRILAGERYVSPRCLGPG